ncbi:MAG: SMC family ATPase, partial [Nanoarchaeota archaeon]
MLLKSIRLHNIRSYTDVEILFSSGSTLLSGDIGSGKSTILYAIEFALFGILRGILSGESLLRHGCMEGSVELRFELEEVEVIIKRSLKQVKDTVTQDSGFLSINGMIQPATATELKSRILDLIGYPQQLLNKSRDLVFRYTVYTPQEDMKRILFDEPEKRMSTLRQVFDIDKYRRILSNILILIKSKKDERKQLEGFLLDWEEKKIRHLYIQREESHVSDEINAIMPLLVDAKQQVRQAYEQVASYEHQHIKFVEYKKELDLIDIQLRQLTSSRLLAEQELHLLSQSIKTLQDQLVGFDPAHSENLRIKIQSLRSNIQEKQTQTAAIHEQIAVYRSKIQESTATQAVIGEMLVCKSCLQKVQPEHKVWITQEQGRIINENQHALRERSTVQAKFSAEIQELEQQYNDVQIKLSNSEKLTVLHQGVKERIAMLQQRQAQQQHLHEQIVALLAKKDHALAQLDVLSQTQSELIKAKEELIRLQAGERDLALKHQAMLTTKVQLESQRKLLEVELAKREVASSRSATLLFHIHWLEDTFMPLISLIEKHVLSTIYHHFNGLFVQWFGILLREDTITASL